MVGVTTGCPDNKTKADDLLPRLASLSGYLRTGVHCTARHSTHLIASHWSDSMLSQHCRPIAHRTSCLRSHTGCGVYSQHSGLYEIRSRMMADRCALSSTSMAT